MRRILAVFLVASCIWLAGCESWRCKDVGEYDFNADGLAEKIELCTGQREGRPVQIAKVSACTPLAGCEEVFRVDGDFVGLDKETGRLWSAYVSWYCVQQKIPCVREWAYYGRNGRLFVPIQRSEMDQMKFGK